MDRVDETWAMFFIIFMEGVVNKSCASYVANSCMSSSINFCTIYFCETYQVVVNFRVLAVVG